MFAGQSAQHDTDHFFNRVLLRRGVFIESIVCVVAFFRKLNQSTTQPFGECAPLLAVNLHPAFRVA